MFYSKYKMSITENEFGYIYFCFMLHRFGSRHNVPSASVTTRANPHIENP